MSSICPTNCADFNLVETKSASCELTFRDMAIRSIGFYKCDLIIPKPLDATALKALMIGENPSLVFSNELVNVQVGEPQFEARKISDSRPEMQEITSREISFQDRIAVNLDKGGASKPFADYEFWKDKKNHATRLNFVFAMSDGSLIVPREKNSNRGMSANFTMFLNYEAKSKGGAIEFKQGKIEFLGDPLDFVIPSLNLNDTPEFAGLF